MRCWYIAASARRCRFFVRFRTTHVHVHPEEVWSASMLLFSSQRRHMFLSEWRSPAIHLAGRMR